MEAVTWEALGISMARLEAGERIQSATHLAVTSGNVTGSAGLGKGKFGLGLLR